MSRSPLEPSFFVILGLALVFAGMVPQETVSRYFEAPLLGWKFVAVRVVPSLASPVIAGWLVKTYLHE